MASNDRATGAPWSGWNESLSWLYNDIFERPKAYVLVAFVAFIFSAVAYVNWGIVQYRVNERQARKTHREIRKARLQEAQAAAAEKEAETADRVRSGQGMMVVVEELRAIRNSLQEIEASVAALEDREDLKPL